MATQTYLSANVSTNIEIRDLDGKLLCQTSNTLTNRGKSQIGRLLTSTARIDSVILSETINTGATQLMFADAIYLDIINSFSTTNPNTGELTINIEAQGDASAIGNITLNSIGLSIGEVLFSVASAGGIVLSNTPISILYQIKLTLTQE